MTVWVENLTELQKECLERTHRSLRNRAMIDEAAALCAAFERTPKSGQFWIAWPPGAAQPDSMPLRIKPENASDDWIYVDIREQLR